LDRLVAHLLIATVAQCHPGCNGDGIARMDTHWVEGFDRTDDDDVVVAVAEQFQLKLLPAQHCLLYQYFVRRRGLQAPAESSFKFFFFVHKTTAGTAERVRWADNQWETDFLSGFFAFKKRVGDF